MTQGLTQLTPTAIGEMTLRVLSGPVGAREFQRFLEYDYAQDFLSPSDEWSFLLDEPELSADDKAALAPRAPVQATVNGTVQSFGYVDKVEYYGSRDQGSLCRVVCRDWLAPAVDAHLDTSTRFVESMTLLDVLTSCFGPFGMTVASTDNSANRNALLGRKYGTPTTTSGKPLKSYITHELKPYPQEGVFAFASRVSQRFGLWLWPATDGKTVVVGQPDFDQSPSYGLQNRSPISPASLGNNVTEWHVERDGRDQPSIIFTSGFGAGGDFPKSRLRSAVVNPVVQAPPGTLESLLAKYPSVQPINIPDARGAVQTELSQAFGIAQAFVEPNARPLYLYDSESHDQAQLEAYTLREMSLRMRKAFAARYRFPGHLLNGAPVVVDTIASVDDDPSGFHGNLWVLARQFSKSRERGTSTRVELILPGSLVF